MTTQVALRADAFAGEADLVAIADLYNHCSQVDHLDSWLSLDELREDLSEPDFDPTQDLRLWRDGAGTLLATAELWQHKMPDRTQAYLSCFIHPSARGQVEPELMAWAETRLRQMAETESHPRIELHAGCRDTQGYKMSLFSAYGFDRVRAFYRMARSLSQPLPMPQLPDGFQVRPVTAEQEAIAWVEMFNQTFIDHWNHSPATVEDFSHAINLPSYMPSLDLVAVAPDGNLAAFCRSTIFAEENEKLGRKEGWVTGLGTRRGYRRLGVARAMLRMGMQALARYGMDTVLLGVDSENPSGALRLYQSEGFQLRHRSVAFSKCLES
jgi:mycothiol synthase